MWDALHLPIANCKSFAKRSRKIGKCFVRCPPRLSQKDELPDNEILLSVEHIESDDSARIQQNDYGFFELQFTLTKLHKVNNPDYKRQFVFNLYYVFKLCLKNYNMFLFILNLCVSNVQGS
jgi:hypothetical protein